MKKIKEFIVLILSIGIMETLYHIFGFGCLFKAFTGISCPGCGMTRACNEALHFQFRKAFYYHPLFWMIPIFFILFFLWDRISPKRQKIIVISIICIFFFVYLIRLFDSQNTVVSYNIKQGIIGKIFKF